MPINKPEDKVYQLLCEGRCNPDISALDSRIEAEMRRMERLTLATMDWVRQMRYTSHLMGHRPDLAFCTICGWTRRYGAVGRNTCNTLLTEEQESSSMGSSKDDQFVHMGLEPLHKRFED